MTTITVEPTERGILVSEAGNSDVPAALEMLPPLTAARYLFVASDASESLRQNELPLVECIRPHAHSTLVALESGFGSAASGEDEAPAMRLAATLGVTVIAPEGRFIPCDGALFAVGADSEWVAYSPRGARTTHGRRYPEPAWQSHLPSKVKGTVQIPAGLWITASADPSHGVHLAGISVHPQQLLIVVGSPSEPTPPLAHILDVLHKLPDETRASAVLIGYDETSLDRETIRLLAAELQQPLRVAHGVTIDGKFVRLDLARQVPTGTFAKESVCTPDGTFTLERWSAPLGLTTVSRNTYQLTPDWLVDVVPAGLVVRPAHQSANGEGDALPIVSESLTVMLRGDGARDLKRVAAPLRMLLGRLRDYAPTQLIPGDRAARRLIRDSFPGIWAPTARLAVTEDGRIIAASVDEEELPVVEEDHTPVPSDSVEISASVEISDSVEISASEEISHSETTAHSEEAPEIEAPREAEGNSESEEVSLAPALPPFPMLNLYKETSREHSSSPTQPTTALVEPVAVVGQLPADTVSPTAPSNTPAPHDSIGGLPADSITPSAADAPPGGKANKRPSIIKKVLPRRHPSPRAPKQDTPASVEPTRSRVAATNAAKAAPQSVALPSTTSSDPSDALARALRGSAVTTDLLANATSRSTGFDAADAISGTGGNSSSDVSLNDDETRSTAQVTDAPPRREVARAQESVTRIPVDSATVAASASNAVLHNDVASDVAPPASVAADVIENASPEAATAPEATVPPAPAGKIVEMIDVPRLARSTAAQRHRVRTALGTRYDVASRSVSQLIAQQPGMRMAGGDRATLLTTLSVVSVFANDPTARYDVDFHTCLAEGLASLPTTRSIVVRGLAKENMPPTNSTLYSPTPFISAPIDAPLTGPMEALIWTTSGRRLDRLMHGDNAAKDIIVPSHTQLRVLGTADGPVPRLLLAEEGVNDDSVLGRLQDAAARRDNDPRALEDSRWLGDLLAAG